MRWFVLCVVLALVVGCGGTSGSDPVSTPLTDIWTPSAGSGNMKDFATMSEDELYQEADRVYRRMYEIIGESERMGIYDPVPAELDELTTGGYREAVHKLYAQLKEINVVTPDAPQVIITTRIHHDDFPEQGIIELEACRDGRNIKSYDREGNLVSIGKIGFDTLSFSIQNDQLVIDRGHTEGVELCPF